MSTRSHRREILREVLRGTEGLLVCGSGVETTLLYKTDFPLREFAAFETLLDEKWKKWVEDEDVRLCRSAFEVGARVAWVDTLTWRLSPDYLTKLGYVVEEDMMKIAAESMKIVDRVREACQASQTCVLGVADVGPRRDAYTADDAISVQEAYEYHIRCIRCMDYAGADIVTAYTLTTVDEAVGIVKAANEVDIPIVICFTTETDGLLPSGTSLSKAIQEVDSHPEVRERPLFFGVNCTHPSHIEPVLRGASPDGWIRRLRGIRGNASSKSHEELDKLTTLDEGDPTDWGERMMNLKRSFPSLCLFGGCCGTSEKHLLSFLNHLN